MYTCVKANIMANHECVPQSSHRIALIKRPASYSYSQGGNQSEQQQSLLQRIAVFKKGYMF